MNPSKSLYAALLSVVGLWTASAGIAVSADQKSDLRVFDMVLNSDFDIRECRYEVRSVPTGKKGLLSRNVMTQTYVYTETQPDTGKCFQKEGPGYTIPPMDGNLNPLPLPPAGLSGEGDARIIYADDSRPALVGDKWIWVRVEDSKIKSIKFYFPVLKIKDVRRALDAKYGVPSQVDELYLDRYEEGRLEYYVARWNLPTLSVRLNSVDTSMDYEGGRNSVGHARIEYGRQVVPKDSNPL